MGQVKAISSLQVTAGMVYVMLQHTPASARLFAVFHVPDFTGEPTESDEMAPVWMDQAHIPYDKMWADDIHW